MTCKSKAKHFANSLLFINLFFFLENGTSRFVTTRMFNLAFAHLSQNSSMFYRAFCSLFNLLITGVFFLNIRSMLFCSWEYTNHQSMHHCLHSLTLHVMVTCKTIVWRMVHYCVMYYVFAGLGIFSTIVILLKLFDQPKRGKRMIQVNNLCENINVLHTGISTYLL